jgi:hypothetical protein
MGGVSCISKKTMAAWDTAIQGLPLYHTALSFDANCSTALLPTTRLKDYQLTHISQGKTSNCNILNRTHANMCVDVQYIYRGDTQNCGGVILSYVR